MKLLSEKYSLIAFASQLLEELSFCLCVIQDDRYHPKQDTTQSRLSVSKWVIFKHAN